MPSDTGQDTAESYPRALTLVTGCGYRCSVAMPDRSRTSTSFDGGGGGGSAITLSLEGGGGGGSGGGDGALSGEDIEHQHSNAVRLP